MTNALMADNLSTGERLDEIAEILAAGLMRLRVRQSTPLSGAVGDCSLDRPARQRGHANPLTNDGGLA